MEFEKIIRDRFSVRRYSDKVVEEEKLNAILESGRLAPSAKNYQPVKMYVFKSESALSMVDEFSHCRYNAPICIVVCGDTDQAYREGDYTTYEMDASIVCTHMMLEATNVGLGSTWIKLIDEDMISEKLNLPENIKPVCMLNIGYKTDDCMPAHLHNERKSLEEMVEYL